MRRSGSEVVLLKAMAGATQAGNLKMRVRRRPTKTESSVYDIDHTVRVSFDSVNCMVGLNLLRTGTYR